MNMLSMTTGSRPVRLALVLCAGLLAACAGPPDRIPVESRSEAQELAQGSAGPSLGPHHLSVPFFPDDKDQCGPAALASILTFWGIPTAPQDLKKEIYMPRLGGTLPMDLLFAAKARGLKAEMYTGSLDDLKAELEAGRPLVAFLNLGNKLFPQGHYVVVTGYDEERQGVYIHSGQTRDEFVPYNRFIRSWGKTGLWTLLVQPHWDREKASA
ncbi:MAG: C39 family peptidase [Nitrospirota bacterium]